MRNRRTRRTWPPKPSSRIDGLTLTRRYPPASSPSSRRTSAPRRTVARASPARTGIGRLRQQPEIVEADDGHVFGHTQAAPLQQEDHADRHLVVAAQDGRGTVRAREQAFDRRPQLRELVLGIGRGAVQQPRVVRLHAVRGQQPEWWRWTSSCRRQAALCPGSRNRERLSCPHTFVALPLLYTETGFQPTGGRDWSARMMLISVRSAGWLWRRLL
jgi:hypothetical protein